MSNIVAFDYPDWEGTAAPIYSVNPLELISFKGQFVNINTLRGRIYSGLVFTIDPVSLSVVLGRREKAESQIEIILVLGRTIKKISISTDDPLNGLLNYKEIENVFPKLDCSRSSHSTSAPKELTPEPTFTEEQVKKRKQDVKAWLKKNLLPVTENGELLTVAGGVTIHPPYITCTTGNQIIKSKIGMILSSMPEAN